MLNVNEEIIHDLCDSEVFLLEHLASFGKSIFPENDLIMLRTRWGKSKLDKYKKMLVNKGYLFVQKRFKFDDNGKSVRDSNQYYLKEGTVTQYLGKKISQVENEKLKTENEELKNQIEELKSQVLELKEAEKSRTKSAKTKTAKSAKKTTRPNIDDCKFAPDYSDKLKALLIDFLEYKRIEKKEYYKTQRSLQRVVDAFYEGSKKHGILAVKIALESTKLNQYSGIFINKPTKIELGNYENGNNNGGNVAENGNAVASFEQAMHEGKYDIDNAQQDVDWTEQLAKETNQVEQSF